MAQAPIMDGRHFPLCADVCTSPTAIATRKMECGFFSLSDTRATVAANADHVPLCLPRDDQYNRAMALSKCAHNDCWPKGVLWHTDTGEVRERAAHARDRLSHPMKCAEEENTQSNSCVSDSD